jgi:uncharacterized protein (DUF58 family)
VRPERSPARPGPGEVPASVLKALELDVRRRIDGLMAGDFPSTSLGSGMEFLQVRPYEIGDDIRRIEWNVTARTRVPHVRVEVAERALTSWIVLDVSQSMGFGTADRRKADVAEGVVLTVAHLAARRAGRIGLVLFGGDGSELIPPRGGRRVVFDILWQVHSAVPRGNGGASLGDALRRSLPAMRTRSAVFVISDLIGPPDWRRPLINVAGRHNVTAVEIRDPREDALPDIGDVWFADPETGSQLRVDTSDRDFRRRFANAAAEERDGVRRILRATGAKHVVLSTEGDWLRQFATFLRRERQLR